MSIVRRHLASLSLAVVLCQIAVQVLVPAALCCESAAPDKADAAGCAGSHPGQLCPMHARKPADVRQSNAGDCHAAPVNDLGHLLVTFLTGDLVSPPAALAAPTGSEPAPPS